MSKGADVDGTVVTLAEHQKAGAWGAKVQYIQPTKALHLNWENPCCGNAVSFITQAKGLGVGKFKEGDNGPNIFSPSVLPGFGPGAEEMLKRNGISYRIQHWEQLHAHLKSGKCAMVLLKGSGLFTWHWVVLCGIKDGNMFYARSNGGPRTFKQADVKAQADAAEANISTANGAGYGAAGGPLGAGIGALVGALSAKARVILIN